MKAIERVPVTLSGLMLGCFALGNLLQSYGQGLRYGCGILASLLLLLLVMNFLMKPKKLWENLNNPVLGGILGTFSMGIMLLSGYLPVPALAQVVYWLGVALHIALILFFTVRHVFPFRIEKCYTSWFVVYCGIATASVVAPAFSAEAFGTFCFWFALIAFLVLVIPVTLNYRRNGYKEPLRHLVYIYAAPLSLCVAAYVQSVTPKNATFLLLLYMASILVYFWVLIQSVRYLSSPFYPSDAAYTFPFVISAIAAKQCMACMANLSMPQPWLESVVLIETVICVLLIARTYYRFMRFIFGSPMLQTGTSS